MTSFYELQPNGWQLPPNDKAWRIKSPFYCYTMERDRDPAYAGSDCGIANPQHENNETSSC